MDAEAAPSGCSSWCCSTRTPGADLADGAGGSRVAAVGAHWHYLLVDNPTGSPVILVEAATWLVFRRTVYVIGQPRQVVVRRLPARDVTDIDEVA